MDSYQPRYETAFPKGAGKETEMLLDMLSAAVGFRCSFAWGSKRLLDEPCDMWQVMPEIGAEDKNPDAEHFFNWHVVKNADEQWRKSCLEVAHAFFMAWVRWERLGKPRVF
jgi:hypothetical protein